MEHIESVVERLSQLSKPKIIFFGALACEKIYPSYLKFTQDTNWGNIKILDTALILMYELIINDNNEVSEEIVTVRKQILNISPNTNDFPNPLASYALDACSAFDEVLSFILNDEIDHIENALTNVLDTVDMFVQEKEDLDPNDPELEDLIVSDEFMINEKKRQLLLLAEIENLNNLNSPLITKLREANNNLPKLIDLELIY